MRHQSPVRSRARSEYFYACAVCVQLHTRVFLKFKSSCTVCTYVCTYVMCCATIQCTYVHSEEVYSPEELLAMIFNTSRQVAQDYAGMYILRVFTYISLYVIRIYMYVCIYMYVYVCPKPEGIHIR